MRFRNLEWAKDEVTAERPEYEGQATWNYFGGVRPQLFISDKFDLVSVFRISKLGQEIADSPTVSKDIECRFMMGIVYKL